MMGDFEDLIQRLEKAEGPSYVLDCAIGEFVRASMRYQHPGSMNPTYPPYTASLDAAVGLVPEGWSLHMNQHDGGEWSAELREGYATSYGHVALAFKHPTLPLALCIAALKARKAAQSQDG